MCLTSCIRKVKTNKYVMWFVGSHFSFRFEIQWHPRLTQQTYSTWPLNSNSNSTDVPRYKLYARNKKWNHSCLILPACVLHVVLLIPKSSVIKRAPRIPGPHLKSKALFVVPAHVCGWWGNVVFTILVGPNNHLHALLFKFCYGILAHWSKS